MKRLSNVVLAVVAFAAPFLAQGQFYTNTALKLSEVKQSGTARFQGIGGNHVALGGDASTAFGNPAGLGFYNRSELSISPVIYNNNSSTDYINTGVGQSKGNFNLGHFGLVFAGSPQNSRSDWRRSTWSVTYSRLNNLNNNFQYSGQNNASSFVDWAVEGVQNVNFDVLDKEYNPGTNMAQSIESAMLNLYLFDDTTPAGPPYRKAIPLRGAAAIQNGLFDASGSTGQWTFAYAGNYDDKLYIGASLGLWKANYEYKHTLQEKYANAAPFQAMNYSESLLLASNGINLSAGVIYKPSDNLQLGATFTSPTFSSQTTFFNEEVGVDLTGDIPIYNAAGQPVRNAQGQQQYVKLNKTNIAVEEYDFEYSQTSPLRMAGGATFFIGKKGFLTATAEYVGYNGMRISTQYYGDSKSNDSFKSDNRKRIQSTYNNVVNVRVGGEARLGSFRVRAGGAYLPDPYKTIVDNLDRSRLQFSGGLGYRSDKYFIDVAATMMQSKDAYTPYTMNDSRRTPSAKITNTGVNLAISGGVFF